MMEYHGRSLNSWVQDYLARAVGQMKLGFRNPQRMGHFAPLSFTAFGGKPARGEQVQATCCAGGR